uniref:Transmembrane protein n=1 Tax=Macrostomum lignano TaxID=282301 RepID=A0A1I8F974_9PLAT
NEPFFRLPQPPFFLGPRAMLATAAFGIVVAVSGLIVVAMELGRGGALLRRAPRLPTAAGQQQPELARAYGNEHPDQQAPVLWGSTADRTQLQPSQSSEQSCSPSWTTRSLLSRPVVTRTSLPAVASGARPAVLAGASRRDDDYMYCLMAVNSALLVSFSTLEMAPYCEAVVQRAACYLHENSIETGYRERDSESNRKCLTQPAYSTGLPPPPPPPPPRPPQLPELQRRLHRDIAVRAAESAEYLEGYLAGRMRQALATHSPWDFEHRDEGDGGAESVDTGATALGGACCSLGRLPSALSSATTKPGRRRGRERRRQRLRLASGDSATGSAASDADFRMGFMAGLADSLAEPGSPRLRLRTACCIQLGSAASG